MGRVPLSSTCFMSSSFQRPAAWLVYSFAHNFVISVFDESNTIRIDKCIALQSYAVIQLADTNDLYHLFTVMSFKTRVIT